ncbi:MAG: phosphatidylglycerophosphatase A [Balneolaceae bacterium]
MKEIKHWLGIFFGAGLIPFGPGTWGSLAALPFIYAAAIAFPAGGAFLFAIAASLLSLYTADENIRRYGDDPPQFVMDEVAGQALVFSLISFSGSLPSDALLLAGGFVLFRLFDITKVLGISYVEQFRGKYGILWDDLLAGFYALLCLDVLQLLWISIF